MFTDQLRRAVEASPRCELPRVSAALWKAYAAGQIGEGEAQALSDLIEARKALPAPQKPAQRRVGSRARSIRIGDVALVSFATISPEVVEGTCAKCLGYPAEAALTVPLASMAATTQATM